MRFRTFPGFDMPPVGVVNLHLRGRVSTCTMEVKGAVRFSRADPRDSTLKRLRRVPVGRENTVLGAEVTVDRLDMTDRDDIVVPLQPRVGGPMATDHGSPFTGSSTGGVEVDRGIQVLGSWLARLGPVCLP